MKRPNQTPEPTTLLVLVLSASISAAASYPFDDFLAFNPQPAALVGEVEAQAMADTQRVALYGICGTCVFRQKQGNVWVFEVHAGYGGEKKPDLVIVDSADKIPDVRAFEKPLTQPPAPKPELRADVAGR